MNEEKIKGMKFGETVADGNGNKYTIKVRCVASVLSEVWCKCNDFIARIE